MITQDGYVLSISKQFVNILQKEITAAGKALGEDGLIINFRSSSYSRETGGIMPVEVMVNSNGKILYCTDFRYMGDGELYKELDFAMHLGVFQQMGRDWPIAQGKGLWRTWQSNFVSYYKSNCYDEIEVSKG
jgi:hypothetical protein